MSSEQKKDFYGYRFVIRELPDISDIEIRDIFQRLNRNNVVLNQQELRQATYWGPFIKTMNKLANQGAWNNINVFTSNDVKRMLDVEFISELSIAYLHGLQNKKASLDKYYQLYEEEFEEKERLKEVFDFVLREVTNIFLEVRKTRWSKKTDFYTLFLLLAKHKRNMPFGEEKRRKLHELFLDIGGKVDSFVKVEAEEGTKEVFTPNVTKYAVNLRASSDLGARRNREEALIELTKGVLGE